MSAGVRAAPGEGGDALLQTLGRPVGQEGQVHPRAHRHELGRPEPPEEQGGDREHQHHYEQRQLCYYPVS